MTLLLIQLVLLSVIFASWNAYVILWGLTPKKDYKELRSKYSKIWHGLGWVLRFQIAILIAYVIYWQIGFDWLLILKWELMYIAIASIGYDLIINIIRYIYNGAPPIFYIDNKGINKVFIWLFGGDLGYWIARILFVIGTIIFVAV